MAALVTPSGGSVVRFLRASPNRTLPVKMLRAAVAKELGLEDGAAVKDGTSLVIDKLIAKGRVRMDGKKVVLLKSSGGSKEKDAGGVSGDERAASAAERKRKAADECSAEGSAEEAFRAKLKAGLPAPVPRSQKKAPVDRWGTGEDQSLNAGDTGTRVFLGNLSFKIDEAKLKSAISGITHVKWITDRDTHKFYGTAFVELATPRDASACVAMAGSNVLGRPLKANFAPPRPTDQWPPLVSGGEKDGTGGGGGAWGKGGAVREVSAKPFDSCRCLFVGNLAYDIDEEGLKGFFAPAGEVSAVRWLTRQDTGEFRGMGYVEFWESSAAEDALKLNGEKLKGRPIRLDWDGGGKQGQV